MIAASIAPPRKRETAIVRRLLREPTVDTDTAREFLGIHRDLSFRLMSAYRRRLAKMLARGHTLTADDVRPCRDQVTGGWTEIPNHKVGGKLRCRSDLLLWMVFPERAES